MTDRDLAQAVPSQPRHWYWLLASAPLALAVDVAAAGFGRFAWCGFGCVDAPGVLPVALGSLGAVAVVTFLAVALPQWTAGWRRPVIAAAAAVVAAGLGAAWVFSFG